MKIIKFINSLLLFLLILITIYIVHINFFYVDVILYSAIFDSILAAITISLIFYFSEYFKIFSIFEKIQDRGSGIKKSKIKEIFSKKYLPEHQLIKVRLTEQLESRTIIIENDCVKITKLGQVMAFFSRYFRKHFLAKKDY